MRCYADEVRNGVFPSAAHSFGLASAQGASNNTGASNDSATNLNPIEAKGSGSVH